MNEKLRQAGIGYIVKSRGRGAISVLVDKSTDGCKGCLFMAEAGAQGCNHVEACFGHLRPDNESVIFKSL